MLTQIADGVLIHTSSFMQSNAIVVRGAEGALLIDPGVHEAEIACLVSDLAEAGLPVVAGFSTHPHWDHLLWHESLGAVPRFGSPVCAGAIRARLSEEGFRDRVVSMLPPDIAADIPLDLLGLIDPVPDSEIPWDGPAIRLVQHQAHAAGHAALLIGERRVLVAGDMVSDVLIPLLNLMSPGDPVQEYLDGLDRLESLVADVDVFVPGHGSIGDTGQLRTRIELDRSYVLALREGRTAEDPRLLSGADFLPGLHAMQLERFAAQ